MRREEALAILRRLKPELEERYRISSLGLFGSTARNEAGPTSDVDVVIHIDGATLWTLSSIQDDLESALGRSVDLVPFSEHLRPLFKSRLERDGIYV